MEHGINPLEVVKNQVHLENEQVRIQNNMMVMTLKVLEKYLFMHYMMEKLAIKILEKKDLVIMVEFPIK